MIPGVRRILIVGLVMVLAGCASWKVKEQRTTEGPLAESIWTEKVYMTNGREPNFDERRRWDNAMEQRIGQYLRQNPEAANSLEVSTFKFIRQVSVGQTSEQVLILLGPPLVRVTDAAEMEKLARAFWPSVKENEPTEAWVYPAGWRIYLKDKTVVDITQYAQY
ncbi:MAG: hypothetical protein DMD87_15615 [Candidatus Rokuibacteriota bacterium]|nr:MAG: hypothetical protein DMD87_15615 [Candidatus Rokubacteria bacterium]